MVSKFMDFVPGASMKCTIAVDEELLSAITSKEAVSISSQMSRIFLLLLDLIPVDPNNSLPVAQEWLFKFDGEGEGGTCLNPWRQLQEVVTGIDEQELRRALDWMSERHVINLRDEGSSLYLTIRNVMDVTTGIDHVEASLQN